MKENGIPLVGPECTSPSSWRLEPKMVNYKLCDVATKGVLPRFYIFKSEKLQDDYIKLCKPKIFMAMQKKVWMIFFLFKEVFNFFQKICSKWSTFYQLTLVNYRWA
jgi:hypothetical protein